MAVSPREKNRITKLIDSKEFKNENGLPQYIKSVIAIIFFFLISYILRQEIELSIFGYVISGGALKGVISHLQVLISVYLVISDIKKGHLIAITLNVIGISRVFMIVFIENQISALPGITNNMVSLIFIAIIYRYKKHIIHQFQLLLKQQGRLKNLAFYDSLTGIPNRKNIIDKLDKLMSDSTEEKQFYLVFIDLDNFKKINDTLGHYVGDLVLQMVVKRFKTYIDKNDILGRLGGDEFALIIKRNLDKEEVISYIEGLRHLFIKGFIFNNKDFYLNASFGISKYPFDGTSSGDLLKSADLAMYKAKNSNKYYEFFSRDMQEGFVESFILENGLQTAIEKNELHLVFQPQYNSLEKKLRGFEALLRWDSSELGVVSPVNFIPIAEESGLISEIGEWVLRNAMKKFEDISQQFNIDLTLSINISVVQLLEENFTEMVKNVLKDTGFDSNRLIFEVTETIFISFPDYVKNVLTTLKKMGISIALDDFGTGYASLSYLQNIPIDTLKIDKIFVDHINQYDKKKNIIAPIIQMAHQMGISVIAEGVEDIKQLNYLQQHNCDYIQGFLLGKPMKLNHINEKISVI
ncbi:MAG: putative bifunctional diguanylate cyclase/phosphodiesterase [Halanaerobiaceae bacterium]